MPWPWNPTDPKKATFLPAPNTPVVSQKSAITKPAVPKGRVDKLISGKNQRKRMDDAIDASGG